MPQPELKLLSRAEFKKALETPLAERIVTKGHKYSLLKKIYTDDYQGCDDDLYHISAKTATDVEIALLRIELSFVMYACATIESGVAQQSLIAMYNRKPNRSDPAGWKACAVFHHLDDCAPTYQHFQNWKPVIRQQAQQPFDVIDMQIPQESI